MVKKLFLGMSLVCFFFMFTLAFAQESSPLPEESKVKQQEYALPYAGILPDHPLYFIKNIRDKILLLLISDPIKKAEFFILLADKHLVMAVQLIEQKPELAVKTLNQSIDELKRAKESTFVVLVSINNQSRINSTKDRLSRSIAKHREVVKSLISQVPTRADSLDQIMTKINQLDEEFQKNK